MFTRNAARALCGASLVLAIATTGKSAQARRSVTAPPILTLTAQAIPTIEYKRKHAIIRNFLGYAEIRCAVRNVSPHSVTWGEWTCSWFTEWATDTSLVASAGGNCHANFIQPLTLPPGGTFTRIVPVSVFAYMRNGEKVTFRMRFTPPKPETGRPKNFVSLDIHSVPGPLLNHPLSNPVTLVRRGDIMDAVLTPPTPAAKVPEKAP